MPRPSDGEAALAKVLDLPRLVAAALSGSASQERLSLEIRDEAATIPLYRPAQENPLPARWAIEAGRLATDSAAARPQVTCSLSIFAQLLLGHATLPEAIESKQLRFATAPARDSFTALLPTRPLWFASLDDLLA